jgi:hypothetical protein
LLYASPVRVGVLSTKKASMQLDFPQASTAGAQLAGHPSGL